MQILSLRIMKLNNLFLSATVCALASCSNSSTQSTAVDVVEEVAETADMTSFQDCDLTLGGIHFTKMLNDADK